MPPRKVATVPLPDFFIALVLPKAERDPTPKECEEMMEKTVEFWTKLLKEESFPKKFSSLDLTLQNAHFGSEIGNQQYLEEGENEDAQPLDLDPKFNVYLQITGAALFSSKGSGVPSGNEVFAEMTRGDSMSYLVEYVRKLTVGSVFSTALEVLARRWVVDPASQGGTVRAPTFFVAFGTQPFDDEPPKGPPTDEDVEAFRRRTHEHIEDNLKKEYPNTFVSSEMTVIKHECGTSKPDERFEIYVENDFRAKFSSDPPTEAELFNVIMKCGSTQSTQYLQSCMEIKGSQFEDVSMVTIQVVGLEMPEVEELPPPPEPQTGDPADGEQERDDVEGPIIVNVPIFLALVVNAEPPACLPEKEELVEFKDLMVRYFYTVLHNEYPDSIVSLKLHEEYTQFDGGIPEPRFNMCTEYDAEIHFKPGTDPVPDEKELNFLILECNLSTILAYVRKLTPLCFQQTTEVTMRRISQKQNPDDPIKDAVFEASIERPPAPALLSPPMEPDPVAREEPKAPIVHEPPKRPPRKLAAVDPEPVEEVKPEVPLVVDEHPEEPPPRKEKKPEPTKKPEARVQAPEPKKEAPKKKKAPTKAKKEAKSKPPPVDDGYASPKEDGEKHAKVKCSDVYVALKLDRVDSAPSASEMEELRKNTQDFFSLRLQQVFPNKFSDMDLQIGLMEWGKGKPKETYNLYVEWIIVARFRDLSCPSSPSKTIFGNKNRKTAAVSEADKGDEGLPDTVELTRSLVKGVNIIDYLVQHVRIMEGSSFENATAVFIQQRVNL
jgi:hypothetical protein